MISPELRRWSRRARGAAVALVAGALTLAVAPVAPAGAASSANSARAAQLVENSFTVSKAASSVTVNGSIVNGKQTIFLHVHCTKNGNGYGSITVQGQTIKLIEVGSVNYFKASTSYWQKVVGSKSSLVVPVYANHWVKSSGSGTPQAGFAEFVNLESILGGFNTTGVKWVITGRTTYHGQRVTVVRGTQHGMTGTLLIAAHGQPYLLALEPPHGQGTLRFSNYNQTVQVKGPSQWVAFSTLGGSTGGSGGSSSG